MMWGSGAVPMWGGLRRPLVWGMHTVCTLPRGEVQFRIGRVDKEEDA